MTAHLTPVSLPAWRSLRDRSHQNSYLIQNRHLPTFFTDDKWPTTLPSLGSFSKRRRTTFFKIGGDSSDDDSEDEFPPHPVLKRKLPSFSPGLPSTTPCGCPPSIPEVSSPSPSPPRSPRCDDSPTFQSERPSVVRPRLHTTSLLVNSKPLKSSLKSSSTGSAVVSGDDEDSQGQSQSTSTSSTPKNVHFADILTSVRVFHRFACPADVSLPPDSGYENDDDVEPSSDEQDSFDWSLWSTPWRSQTSSTPPCRLTVQPTPISSTATNSKPVPFFQIDSLASSPIPYRSADWTTDRCIVLESLILVGGISLSETRPANNENLRLTGTVLVRNVSFEKKVDIRFTLDNWDTVSEVGALWSNHINVLPPGVPGSLGSLSLDYVHQEDFDRDERGWDRFSFTISLCDYIRSLPSKTLSLAARFQAENNQEWWDNNSGYNYTLRFREVTMRRTIPDEPLASAHKMPTFSPKTEILLERMVSPPSISQEHPLNPNYTPPLNSRTHSPPSLPIPSTPKPPPIITNAPVAPPDLDSVPPCPPNSPTGPTPTALTDAAQLCRLSLSKFASPPPGHSAGGSLDCLDGVGSSGHSNILNREPKVEVTREKFLDDDVSCSSSDDDFDEMTSCSSEDDHENDDDTPPITPLEETGRELGEDDILTNTKLAEFVWTELPAFEGFSTSTHMLQGSIDSSHILYKMLVQRWCYASSTSSCSV
ncbi:hypothetical protein DL96DRAFT_1639508 [Flagelloscypha sp. PMI_526]|nr:hypothetical protein DL96DRAFT_1639508 [Flagelloscypha sp. PMI_526]